MAAPSIQTLQRIADDTGHQAGTLEKVLRLLDILQETAGDTILSERLALKGGTALNVFHLGLDRLSVDIDLNYVGALDRSAMEAERPEVEAALNRLLASQGYFVRRRPDEHAGGKWLLRFDSALGGNGLTAPFGWLPAEKARKRPAPSLARMLSARIERAELPVQRNRTL